MTSADIATMVREAQATDRALGYPSGPPVAPEREPETPEALAERMEGVRGMALRMSDSEPRCPHPDRDEPMTRCPHPDRDEPMTRSERVAGAFFAIIAITLPALAAAAWFTLG